MAKQSNQTGSGCIKHLSDKREFSVTAFCFLDDSSRAILDHSVEGSLLRIRNQERMKEHEERSRKAFGRQETTSENTHLS